MAGERRVAQNHRQAQRHLHLVTKPSPPLCRIPKRVQKDCHVPFLQLASSWMSGISTPHNAFSSSGLLIRSRQEGNPDVRELWHNDQKMNWKVASFIVRIAALAFALSNTVAAQGESEPTPSAPASTIEPEARVCWDPDGTPGCCVTALNTTGTFYETITVADLGGCVNTCLNDVACVGMNFRGDNQLNNCDLSSDEASLHHTDGNDTCGVCCRCGSVPTAIAPQPTVATTTTTPADPGCWEISPIGCCQTATNGSGTFTVQTTATMRECAVTCEAEPECLGMEYLGEKPNNCKLHTDVAVFHHTDGNASCGACCQCRTPAPTQAPTTPAPTADPTSVPSAQPTDTPTTNPTAAPTSNPTSNPTATPTASPTASPSAAPTTSPTATPSHSPTASPSASPTFLPSSTPTAAPTAAPTVTPTETPTVTPTASPTASPTAQPTSLPTVTPSVAPTASPTALPSAAPTSMPTASPTHSPSAQPSAAPTTSPTAGPTAAPTASPTTSPTIHPTDAPTTSPTARPSARPTDFPTASPTSVPTTSPTSVPTKAPTTAAPTAWPTIKSFAPTAAPTLTPTSPTAPTPSPTLSPTARPSTSPTKIPTRSPTPICKYVGPGCCRSESLVVHATTSTSLPDRVACQDSCLESNSCVGYEYFNSINRCAHHKTLAFDTTNSSGACADAECFECFDHYRTSTQVTTLSPPNPVIIIVDRPCDALNVTVSDVFKAVQDAIAAAGKDPSMLISVVFECGSFVISTTVATQSDVDALVQVIDSRNLNVTIDGITVTAIRADSTSPDTQLDTVDGVILGVAVLAVVLATTVIIILVVWLKRDRRRVGPEEVIGKDTVVALRDRRPIAEQGGPRSAWA
eukprot:m.402938 g.402938  ORF g.402938 m.402938 type:complete len:860 (-) comp16786_c0_seq1:198-2777(-)